MHDEKPRHLTADDFDDPPTWAEIAFWAVVATLVLPLFLSWLGSF